jgi:type IV secretory pathway VirB10-like protein
MKPLSKDLSRKKRIREQFITNLKKRMFIIFNLSMLFLILASLINITNNTYTYFTSTEGTNGQFSTMTDFCSDKDYEKDNKELCKDNSGIGNGCEEADDCEEEKGDEDNPKHGNKDDHPKENETKDSEKPIKDSTDDPPDTNSEEEPEAQTDKVNPEEEQAPSENTNESSAEETAEAKSQQEENPSESDAESQTK